MDKLEERDCATCGRKRYLVKKRTRDRPEVILEDLFTEMWGEERNELDGRRMIKI